MQNSSHEDSLNNDATQELNITMVDDILSSRFAEFGDFVLESELGRGGMGVVYKANQLSLNRKVALKMLPPNTPKYSPLVRRFVVEANAAAQLDHDNIVPVYHIGEHHGTQFFTMKLIEGADLAKVIKSAKDSLSRHKSTKAIKPSASTVPSFANANPSDSSASDQLSSQAVVANTGHSDKQAQAFSKKVAKIGYQVALALNHAHENGIVHRDIKPSNLLMEPGGKVWVSDFGLAHLQNSEALTNSGDILGTIRYMSPEQASGRRGFVDQRTDIYSLGVTLFELATLQPARSGKTAKDMLRQVTFERPPSIRKLNPGLPIDFETIICRATERDPEDRYTSALELASDLEKFANNERIATRRTSRMKYIGAWLAERPVLTAVSSIAAGILILGMLFGLVAIYQAKESIAQLVEISESGRMTAEAARVYPENPGLGIALCLKADSLAPTYENDAIMMVSMAASYEKKALRIGERLPGKLVYSPDGKRLLLCAHPRYFDRADIKPTFFDLETFRAGKTLDSQAPVTSAAYSPDGRYLLTTGCSLGRFGAKSYSEAKFASAMLWTTPDSERKQRMPKSRLIECREECFSQDSRLIVLPFEGNVAEIHAIEDWSNRTVLQGHSGPVLQAIFSPDQKHVATWSMDERLRLFNSQTAELLLEIEHETRKPESVKLEFSSNSKWVLACGDLGLRVVRTDDSNRQYFRPERKATFLAYSEELALLEPRGKLVRGFNPSSGLITCEIDCPETIRNIEAIPQEKKLMMWSGDSTYLVDFEREKVTVEFKGHEDIVLDIAGHPIRKEIATIGWDQTIRFWNLESNKQLRTFRTKIIPYADHLIDYSPDGQQIAVGTVKQSKTSLWKLEGNSALANVPGYLRTTFSSGNILTSNRGELEAWDTQTLRRLAKLRISEDVDKALVLDDERHVVIQTARKRVILWDTTTNQSQNLTGKGESAEIADDAFGSSLLIGTENGELIILDTQSLVRRQLARLDSRINDVNFSEDGTHAVVATESNRLQVWDLEENKAIADFETEIGAHRCYLSNRAKAVVVHEANRGRRVSLWNFETSKKVATREFSRLWDVQLNTDGQTAALATIDGCHVWDLNNNQLDRLTEYPCRRAGIDEQFVYAAIYANPNTENTNAIYELPALLAIDRESKEVVQHRHIDFQVYDIQPQQELNQVLVSGESRGAEIVDIATGGVNATLDGHASDLVSLGYTQKGQSVVTISKNGLILEAQLANDIVRQIAKLDAPVEAAAFSPDRSQLVVSSKDGRTTLWDLTDPAERIQEDLGEVGQPATRIELGTNGVCVIQRDAERLTVLDLNGQQQPQEFQFDGGVRSFRLSPDSKLLLVLIGEPGVVPSSTNVLGLTDPTPEAEDIVLVDLQSKEQRAIRIPFTAVAGQFYASGKTFAILGSNGAVHLFRVDPSQKRIELRDKRPYLSLCGCDQQSSTLFAADANQIVGWDALTGDRKVEIYDVISEIDALVHLANWQIHHEESKNLVLFGNKTIVRYPKEPAAYVKQLAPRELTNLEIKKYRPGLSAQR